MLIVFVFLYFLKKEWRCLKESHIHTANELLWNVPTEDKNKALNRVNDVTNTVDKPGFLFGCLSVFPSSCLDDLSR